MKIKREDSPEFIDDLKKLPKELQDQPALLGRRKMAGVATPEPLPDSDSDSNSSIDVELIEEPLNGARPLRSNVPKKPKKIPEHLTWEPDSGSDSDYPNLKAPGWNLPLERVGYKKGGAT